MNRGLQSALAVIGVAILATTGGGPVAAQQPRSRSFSAGGMDVPAGTARIDAMLRSGDLISGRRQADSMLPGRVHERLAQYHQGLPVYGGEIVRQLIGDGVTSVFGRVYEAVSVPSTTPAIAPGDAASLAAAAAGTGAVAGDVELGILPEGDRFALVYRVLVRGPWDLRTYYVDASTGQIVHDVSRIRSQQVSVGRGRGVLNDEKKVSAAQTGNLFEAIDLLRPATGFTLDFKGNIARLNTFLLQGRVFASDVAVSPNASWTDGAVVDVHVYQGWVYDYYFKRFGRRGLDDDDLPVISIVHPVARAMAGALSPEDAALFVNNAVYLGNGFMLYGDGDGSFFDYFGAALDVVAHEMTHGVTEFTSGLFTEDEPGALNEAFSDMMATGTEFFHLRPGQGPQRGPNFLLAEDITRVGPGFLRSLSNPNANGLPDHYSLRRFIGTPVDDGGVHVNATIPGHAFYLAVAGGTNRVSGLTVQGVGLANMERIERIFYRAFTFFLSPAAQFIDARNATLQAAADLYGAGSVEQTQVRQAWDAVGVQ